MNKPVRRRRAPTELRISENSKAAMQARLQSEEGQRCLDEFASVVAEWAKFMPIQLLRDLDTPEGGKYSKISGPTWSTPSSKLTPPSAVATTP